MKNLLISICCVLLLLFSSNLHAQLLVNSALTPDQMVQNIIGAGVTYSNVTYTGSTTASGSFSTGALPTNIGISSGIILSSGTASIAIGPNSSGSSGQNNGQAGDPDLAAISAVTSNDACILEFDFIPVSDSVKFKYVFASDEYHEFSNSNVNDAFGFFLSGPLITGPFSSPTTFPGGSMNIALIPGTTTGVSINTVNNGTTNVGPCLNCNFFVHNPGSTIEYDAFTTVLVAQAKVIPCLTHHIKLAIGDGGDFVYDSGVFIQENSFSSTGITVGANFNNIDSSYAAVDSAAVEGCNDAVISFTIDYTRPYPLIINYVITGTATNGVDFPAIPTSMIIPAGSDSVGFTISPFLDGIVEPTEELTLIVSNSCTFDTITILIRDNSDLVTQASTLSHKFSV